MYHLICYKYNLATEAINIGHELLDNMTFFKHLPYKSNIIWSNYTYESIVVSETNSKLVDEYIQMKTHNMIQYLKRSV